MIICYIWKCPFMILNVIELYLHTLQVNMFLNRSIINVHKPRGENAEIIIGSSPFDTPPSVHLVESPSESFAVSVKSERGRTGSVRNDQNIRFYSRSPYGTICENTLSINNHNLNIICICRSEAVAIYSCLRVYYFTWWWWLWWWWWNIAHGVIKRHTDKKQSIS